MTEILGSFGLERRTLFDRDGVAIGTVEELYSGAAAGGRSEWAGVGIGLLDRDAASNSAASTPRTVREPVSAGGTAPAL
jgi:hypothetical protein